MNRRTSLLLFVCVATCSVSGPGEAEDAPARKPPLIMIDPGHGGSEVAGTLKERSNSSPNNARTPGGLLEKDLTLEFSKILKEEILAEATRRKALIGVVLTREEDVNLDFVKRARYCNQEGAACVVSIHFNAGGGPGTKGSLALISAAERNPNYELDKEFGTGLAEACSAGVREFVPGSKSKGTITDGHLHGGLGSNFFFQLARQPHLKEVPKAFLEVEFIDNPEVEKQLLQSDREVKFRAISRSIAAYLVDYTLK